MTDAPATSRHLSGRVAIVTGAARGVGRAVVERLAHEGCAVAASDFDGAVLQEAMAALAPSGAPITRLAGDITRDETSRRLVDAAVKGLGGLDIIVNCAGYIWPAAAHKMTDEQFDAILDVHVKGPFLLLRAAAPFIREASAREAAEGRPVFRKVVNISSIVATAGAPMSANYAAAKAAVHGLTLTLAKEWGRYRVNVNCLAFGMFATRLNDPEVARDPVLSIAGRNVNIGAMGAQAEAIAQTIPLGRAGTVAEAAGAVFLFCAPEADYVSGQIVAVDGGLS